MSLALVEVSSSDFEFIHRHLVSYDPRYRNMHLRAAHVRNKKRELLYLHAMYAPQAQQPEIDGMISGPSAFWHYKLVQSARGQTQLNVISERGTPKALARIQRRFLKEILARARFEQTRTVHYPKRLPGQFYLRRSLPGMPANHRSCVAAVTAGILDRRFVSQLDPWNLELLRP